jgi:hypothetical protein
VISALLAFVSFEVVQRCVQHRKFEDLEGRQLDLFNAQFDGTPQAQERLVDIDL